MGVSRWVVRRLAWEVELEGVDARSEGGHIVAGCDCRL